MRTVPRAACCRTAGRRYASSADTAEARVILGGAMIVLSVFFAWSAWLVLRLHPLGPWLALLLIGLSAGGETCGGGLHMIDIRDPKNPVFAGCYAEIGTGRAGTGYTHDAQCVVYGGPDAAYQGREVCFGSNETAIVIADVTGARILIVDDDPLGHQLFRAELEKEGIRVLVAVDGVEALKIAREQNKLWKDGGLIYAPPFR